MNHEHSFPMLDEIDCMILMHRDVHFGGNFQEMIRYYENKGKGVLQEFELRRIYELAEFETQLQENLAALVLSGANAEQVGKAKQAYKDLRDLYENKTPINRYPILIADLILSEEEEPSSEINTILAEREKIVPELLGLVRSEEFHNPLYPGYGQAPALAAKCLGLIGDKRAIIALFESIGRENDFFEEDNSLEALKLIGKPARDFLVHVVKVQPYNEDNEHAALALGQFKNDPEVATICFEILKNLDFKKFPIFATYLALACEGLKSTPYKEEFLSFVDQPHVPKNMKKDMLSITEDWD